MKKLLVASTGLLLASCAGMVEPFDTSDQRRIQLACQTWLGLNVAWTLLEPVLGRESATVEFVNEHRRFLDPVCDAPPQNNLELARKVEEAIVRLLLRKAEVSGAAS